VRGNGLNALFSMRGIRLDILLRFCFLVLWLSLDPWFLRSIRCRVGCRLVAFSGFPFSSSLGGFSLSPFHRFNNRIISSIGPLRLHGSRSFDNLAHKDFREPAHGRNHRRRDGLREGLVDNFA
jgi:hypothetical protein